MTDAVMHTARLRLRLLDARDAALYRALYTCPQVMHRIMPPMTVAAADAAFVRACRHNTLDAPGHRLWVLECEAGSGAVGIAALQRSGRQAEIGAVLHREWWGRRICSEAFVSIIAHAFNAMGVDEVIARSADDADIPMIERLLCKFDFISVPALACDSGTRRWQLPYERWARASKLGTSSHNL